MKKLLGTLLAATAFGFAVPAAASVIQIGTLDTELLSICVQLLNEYRAIY